MVQTWVLSVSISLVGLGLFRLCDRPAPSPLSVGAIATWGGLAHARRSCLLFFIPTLLMSTVLLPLADSCAMDSNSMLQRLSLKKVPLPASHTPLYIGVLP